MKKYLVISVLLVWCLLAIYFFFLFPGRKDFLDYVPIDMEAADVPVQPETLFTESDAGYVCRNTHPAVEPGDDFYFRWTDDTGVTNVSTDHPGLPGVEIVGLDGAVLPRYFNMHTDMRGGSYIPYFESRLSAQMTVVYNLLGDWIGDDRLRHLEIRMIVFPDRASYRQYALTWADEQSASMGGYYSSARNEAVTWMKSENERTYESARHESIHVIARGLFGDIPKWLNEGLAEYFSLLTVNGQMKTVSVHPDWLNQVKRSLGAGYPVSLADYMSLSREEWNANDYHGNDHYALAWSLVYFFAESDKGRDTLKSLLPELGDNYCTPVDTVTAIDRLYEGGFGKFQADYLQWLGNVEPGDVHRY